MSLTFTMEAKKRLLQKRPSLRTSTVTDITITETRKLTRWKLMVRKVAHMRDTERTKTPTSSWSISKTKLLWRLCLTTRPSRWNFSSTTDFLSWPSRSPKSKKTSTSSSSSNSRPKKKLRREMTLETKCTGMNIVTFLRPSRTQLRKPGIKLMKRIRCIATRMGGALRILINSPVARLRLMAF